MLYPTLTLDESKLEVIFLCVSFTRTRLMLLHKLKLKQLCYEALTSITYYGFVYEISLEPQMSRCIFLLS
jgi:hypothetical protein